MLLSTSAQLAKRQEPEFPDPVPESYRRELLQGAIGGDSVAFARLFDFYVDRIYSYMHFHVPEQQDAEDLTARVFLIAWRSIPCYRPDRTPLSVWLYLIARKALFDFSTRPGGPLIKEIISPADEGLAMYEPVEPCSELM